MTDRRPALFLCFLILAFTISQSVSAESVWVSDQFEIMLRTGPSNSNAIQLMVESGSELDVIEVDADLGYTKVRTLAGTEGWVLTRYLMGEPPAREQLEQLTQQLTSANSDGSSMTTQLQAIRAEQTKATQQNRSLERERDQLQNELNELTRTAANVIAVDRQNQEFRQQLTDAEIMVSTLETANENLRAQGSRYWFITGALVLIGGIVLGLVLPRLKFQRRSRYDRL